MTVPTGGPARRWSASGLFTLFKCGEAYRRRYIDRDYTPATTVMLRGRAVARAAALGLLAKQRSGVDQPVDLYEDVAAAEIDRARLGGATLTPAEASAGIARTFGALKDETVAYASRYGATVAPAVTPLAVERKVVVEGIVPGVTVSAVLDVVAQGPHGEIVRDAKTTGRRPDASAAATSQQLTLYALVRKIETDAPTYPGVALDYLVRDKTTGTVTAQVQAATRDDADAGAMVRRILAADRVATAGTFVPTNPENWWCSAKWCEFHPSCPFAVGKTSRR